MPTNGRCRDAVRIQPAPSDPRDPGAETNCWHEQRRSITRILLGDVVLAFGDRIGMAGVEMHQRNEAKGFRTEASPPTSVHKCLAALL